VSHAATDDVTTGASVAGEVMMDLARRLFPINRSLTGDGVRETLRILAERLPLEIVEVPSGTPVYDWTIPPEWNVREAWVADSSGRRIVDLRESSLHVLGYSVPVAARVSGNTLRERLHRHADHPEWIPARTSYYEPDWGFCVTGDQYAEVREGEEYDVLIDSTLDDAGSLTYAEAQIAGREEDEILLSTYVCHPSLANDNVSGIVVLAALGELLAQRRSRYTYRLVFAPSTIGALAWLARNEDGLARLRGGLVVSCVGDRGPLTYKRSRRTESEVDRAAAHVVSDTPDGAVRPFVPWGGDERQFCSPGFDLAVGSLTRTPHGLYAQYHTSADDLSFIDAESLAGSLGAVVRILDVLEGNSTLERVEPRGEPQLGRRGLYEAIGAGLPAQVEVSRQALLWTLNLADGAHTLLEIAERGSLPFAAVRAAADVLLEAGLVRTAR
jgi:aminopeptidase-like protein